MGSFEWRSAQQQTNYYVRLRAEFNFARQPPPARLQNNQSRSGKPAASCGAGTLMPAIMYLPMRNGLSNSFPDHLGDRSQRLHAIEILRTRGGKSRSGRHLRP